MISDDGAAQNHPTHFCRRPCRIYEMLQFVDLLSKNAGQLFYFAVHQPYTAFPGNTRHRENLGL
jgi:hypothetical protein